jgi:hypothetical protein
MRSAIYGTLLALTVTATMAAEDTRSANYMLPWCKFFVGGNANLSPADAFDEGICLGTVAGIADVAGFLPGRRCANIPVGVTNGQEVRVVVRYIEAWPNRMHEEFVGLVLEALANAWPCPK